VDPSRFLLLIVSASALLLVVLVWHDATGERRPTGVVLYSARDSNVAKVVRDLKRAGLYVTDDHSRFGSRVLRGADVIVLTRSALPLAGDSWIGRAYVGGALIAGLDMSLRDLETLIFGSSSRDEMERDAADPRLSMLYQETLAGGCGGHGYFSDWLSNWEPAAAFILHRAGEVSLFAEECS
jgi:hypothetical protein